MMGKRQVRIQFLACLPELKLAGLVTGIRTDFEHRHDDDFDFDRCGRLRSGCKRKPCTRHEAREPCSSQRRHQNLYPACKSQLRGSSGSTTDDPNRSGKLERK